MVYHITADAGSSKTLWVISDAQGAESERIQTAGLNAVTASSRDIENAVNEVLSHLGREYEIDRVRFYGAGCATESICTGMRDKLSTLFATDDVEVASDLLGAARGLLGETPGIACILGTGSNSCFYDGNRIVSNVPSLGYVLGDEGSGNAIGKRLLGDALKGVMPEGLREEFLKEYGLDLSTVIEKVYRQPQANRYLASFAPFAYEHRNEQYVHTLLLDEFGRFLDRNVARYENAAALPLCFTGSIAYHFSDLLCEACNMRGYSVGKITAQPF